MEQVIMGKERVVTEIDVKQENVSEVRTSKMC